MLGWPLPAAVAHTGGAAALVLLLATMLARSRAAPRRAPVAGAARPLPVVGMSSSGHRPAAASLEGRP